MLGGLIRSVGSSLGMKAPEAPKFEVPSALPGIKAPSAAALAEKAGLKVTPEMPAGPTDSPSKLIGHLLNEKEDMLGATQAIAHGLPPKEGVKWAVDSCKKVEGKLPAEGGEAVKAAEALTALPNAANRAAAAAAATKAGLQSPAGMAAKAASMLDVPDAPKIPGADKVIPALVIGTVASAASLSAKPPAKPGAPVLPKLELPAMDPAKIEAMVADAAKQPPAPPPPGPGSPESARNAAVFKPFIDSGLALAAKPG
jgi:hypothetical protein